ncbi:hypothetical protein GGR34_003452 [Microvirga flocculans]|uniref:Uncharacterized protein n=1 Tax=Microvirga flocculans TaxID=217168 RepID=A0A7W6IIL2_9HYPH|nr:hypothetical protein [Microvirga flocculans]
MANINHGGMHRPSGRMGSICLVALILSLTGAQAAEQAHTTYQGAWLAQGSSCADVYSSGGKGVSFKQPIDIFAPAFIISGNRLRTPAASCRVRSIKPAGDRHLMTLDCTNTISSSDVTVLMSTAPDGSLVRYFNAEDTIGSRYQRCSP